MEVGSALGLAAELVRRHGLDGWTVTLDRAKMRAGACRFDARQITLSAQLTRLHDESEVRDTILHEIAHALAGPGHGHDAAWRSTALRIGCTGQRCSSVEAPRVDGSWVGTCQAGHRHHRHRRPERLVSCAICSPRFDVAHLLDWTRHGRPAAMHPNYVAQLAAVRGRVAVTRPAPSVGQVVRVTAPGRFHGVCGLIEKRGRTRFRVRIAGGVLTVPFALVEPAHVPMASSR